MAREYHLTPEGPRICRVDPSNPNSKGCPLGGMHFDSFADAMDVYEDSLRESFGEFHVLVRPKSSEKALRAGYRSLDGIDRLRSSKAVAKVVASLRSNSEEARALKRAVATRYGDLRERDQSRSLPESVATEPISAFWESQEELQAEATSREVFNIDRAESMGDFSKRILPSSSSESFRFKPIERSALDENFQRNRRARFIAETPRIPSYREQKKLKDRLDRARRPQKNSLRKRAAQGALRLSGRALRASGRGMVTAGYVVRATAEVAAESTALKAQRASARAQTAAAIVSRRASLMSIPASHIRPGDTFDGTRVRAVESLTDGRIKISYQAEAGGKLLATTVDQHRSMRVDRKTRREARNSRIGLAVNRPLNRLKTNSLRIAKISGEQLQLLKPIRSSDLRFGAIEASIRQSERTRRQIELEDELRGLLSFRSEARELQLSR